MIMRSISRMFLPDIKPFGNPVRNDDCDFFEVDNWIISRFVVDCLLPVVGCHPFPLNEQMLMTAAVCRIRPSHILEWGTNIGASARIFHEICKAFSIEAEIHSIDLPDYEQHKEHPGQQRGRLVKGISQVKLHQGDGLDVAFSVIADTSRCIDPLFFLDGDHRYESLCRELTSIINTIPTASILVHDTFNQSEESGYNIGPYRAVQDVLRETGAQLEVCSQDLGLPGMTLLWKRT